jgi:DNA-binding transcriptional MerR regulator
MAKKHTEENLMRVSEIAKSAGVSTQTVHYYLREGLLTPPRKTSRNMAYYDPACIEEIRLIKELQAKRFLPLAVIKLVMKAKRDGQDVGHIAEMHSFFDELFHPLGTEDESKTVSLAELVVAIGLPRETLKALEDMGLLLPARTLKGEQYDSLDVYVGRTVKKLMDIGLTLEDLSVYSRYVETIRFEAESLHNNVVHRLHETGDIPLMELCRTLNELKTYLAAKIYRHVVLESHR